jgi:group II intron reverse transcriptase/maturase
MRLGALLERVPGILISNKRWFSDGGRDNVPSRFESLINYAMKNPGRMIDRKLFNLMLDPWMFEKAYDKLKSKPGNMTKALDPETLDGLSDTSIKEIIEKLKDGTFVFNPARTVEIPKANGKVRVLASPIANPRDKLVLEVIRMILEVIYEPRFSDNSHGFRIGRGCHSALKQVESMLAPVTFVIEGDIKGCFDNIDHKILMSILKLTIKDEKFLGIIRQALRVGYGKMRNTVKTNVIGTPQGSVISPMLCNIYMNSFDTFMAKLKVEFDVGNKAARSKEYHRLATQARRARLAGHMDKFTTLMKVVRSMPHSIRDESYKKLTFCRYADDWIVGIRGSRKDTDFILSRIKSFLAETLKIDLSAEKTHVTNISSSAVTFLGTVIKKSHIAFHKEVVRKIKNPVTGIITSKIIDMRHRHSIRLEAPIQTIRKKLTDAGFMKAGKPCPKFMWTALSHSQIIAGYNSVLRGYINYYSFAANSGRFISFLRWVMFFSCGRTLATKFSSQVSKIVQKYGLGLGPEAATKDKYTGLLKVSYSNKQGPGKFNIKSGDSVAMIQALYYSGLSVATLEGLVCSYCGSNYRVEMHHIRMMKDLNPNIRAIDALMAKANRKQIPLCRSCHMDLHKTMRKDSKRNRT